MYGRLFGLAFLCALLTLSYAFLPRGPQRRSHQPSTLICSAAADPGKLLYDAAYAGNVEKMKLLITEAKGDKKILNWNSVERYGRTPLVIASYYGKLEAVQLLLSVKEVDINQGSDFGATALHFAAHRGHMDVVKALLADRRIQVNVKATGGKWTGKTALDVTDGFGASGWADISDLLKSKCAKPGK